MARGYSLDGIANVVYPCFQGALNVDLNTLIGRDAEGKYMQPASANATAANNYPIQEAGMLEVLQHAANGVNNVMQRYTTFLSRRLFIRSQTTSDGNWTGWDEYARMSEIYKQVYPVGAIYTCVNSVNPNSLFPGTTWVQITDGRVLRAATNNTVGTGDGNIGQTGGSETYTISSSMMPVHSHTMSHTHDAPQHTHSVPAHSHTMAHTHGVAAHTHSVPAHSHTMAHTHSMAHNHSMAHTHSTPNHTHSASASTSVTVNSGGAHDHAQRAWQDGGGVTRDWYIDRNVFNKAGFTNLQSRTESGGAHTHSASASTSVTVNSGGGGTTGGSSAASTGGSSAASTGGSSATNTGTQAAMTTGGTALTTGGSSAANTGTQAAMTTGNASALTTGGPSTGSTGNAGGTTSMTVTNLFRRVAVWQRTA